MVAQYLQLANDEVQSSDNSTYSLRLPESGFLHSLYVNVQATNGATSGRDEGPLEIADRVRVAGDGSQRYWDTDVHTIEKWYETWKGRALEMQHNEAASGAQWVNLPIYFGRRFYDPEMFLPLRRIVNPRLEIPYSPTIAADSGFATGTTQFNVMALWSPEEDGLPYRGTLITEEVDEFTSAATGRIDLEIEVGWPIRAIGVYAYEAATADGTDITRVELVANAPRLFLWEGDWDDFIAYTRLKHGVDIRHDFRIFAQDTDTMLVRLSDQLQWNISPLAGSSIANDTFTDPRVSAIAGDQLTFTIAEGDITAGAETYVTFATDARYHLQVWGQSPSYFGMLDWADIDEPRNYLDSSKFNDLELRLTQGGAGATVRTVVNYLRELPLKR